MPGFGFFRFLVDFQFVEQHFAHLCRRAHVELYSRKVDACPLDVGKTLSQGFGVGGKGVCVDAHASVLHVGEHLDERQLDVVEQMRHFLLLEFLVKHRLQLEACRGTCASHLGYILDFKRERRVELVGLCRGGQLIVGQNFFRYISASRFIEWLISGCSR